MKNTITRVHHPLIRRNLVVLKTQYIASKMLRIWLTGPELNGFTSQAPDDHIKLFFPTASGEVESRNYTPRRYDASSNVLWVDFTLHEGGIAATWARQTQAGDTLTIGGPKGSVIIPYEFDWWLLIGDEAAIPAISRRLEEMPQNTKVICIISITDPTNELAFNAPADTKIYWVYRHSLHLSDPTPIINILAKLDLPYGEGFVWAAAEARIAYAVRQFMLEERDHPINRMKVSGYWRYGKADVHEKFEINFNNYSSKSSE